MPPRRRARTAIRFSSCRWATPSASRSGACRSSRCSGSLRWQRSRPARACSWCRPPCRCSTLKDLVDLAKRKPGSSTRARPAPGSFQHLATELFRLQAGINIVIVQYKGGGPALTDTIGGPGADERRQRDPDLPHVRSGKLKALGVGGPSASWRCPRYPPSPRRGCRARRRPTGGESWRPSARRRRWSSGCGRTSRRSWIRPTRASAWSSRAPSRCAWAPPNSRQFMNAETAKWTRVVKEAGIKAE